MKFFDRFKTKEATPNIDIAAEDVPDLALLAEETMAEQAPLDEYQFILDYYGEKYINLKQLTHYIRVEAANFDTQKKPKEKIALYALAKMLEEAGTRDDDKRGNN